MGSRILRFPFVSRRGSGSSATASLDVGSSKIFCAVGESVRESGDEGFGVRVTGFGSSRSMGVRRGRIVDFESAERAIRIAVDAAETMAGSRIERVRLSVSGGRPMCVRSEGTASLGGRSAHRSDAERALEAARSRVTCGSRTILHAAAASYDLDGASPIRNPVGMHGSTLTARMSASALDSSLLRTFSTCLANCRLDAEGFAASSISSGDAVLSDDEKYAGAMCLDMGAETTGISVFFEGVPIFADSVSAGGSAITMDLARGLSLSISGAERLKVFHGGATSDSAGSDRMVSATSMASDCESDVSVPVSLLSGIVRPRLEEIAERALDRLSSASVPRSIRRMVLTGGGSRLSGAREAIADLTGFRVRLGTPSASGTTPHGASGAECSAGIGALRRAVRDGGSDLMSEIGSSPRVRGRAAGGWLGEGF